MYLDARPGDLHVPLPFSWLCWLCVILFVIIFFPRIVRVSRILGPLGSNAIGRFAYLFNSHLHVRLHAISALPAPSSPNFHCQQNCLLRYSKLIVMDAKEKSLINESLPTQEDSQLEPTASQDTEKQENSAQLHFLAAGQSQELQAHYQNLERILRKRTQQRDVYKARYQALATELTKLKSQDQGFSQLDDSYLIQQVEGLRVKIWNFGLHHYGGVVSRGKSLLDPLLSDYTEFNMRSDMDLEYYLELPDWRPAIMEAFLWRLMVAEIFNRFWWAGSVGKSMSRLHRVMKQSNNPGIPHLRAQYSAR